MDYFDQKSFMQRARQKVWARYLGLVNHFLVFCWSHLWPTIAWLSTLHAFLELLARPIYDLATENQSISIAIVLNMLYISTYVCSMYIHTQIDLAQLFVYFSPQKTLGPFIKHVNKFLDIFYALVLKHGFLDDLPP